MFMMNGDYIFFVLIQGFVKWPEMMEAVVYGGSGGDDPVGEDEYENKQEEDGNDGYALMRKLVNERQWELVGPVVWRDKRCITFLT